MGVGGVGGNNFNQNLEGILGKGPGEIHQKFAEKAGMTENGKTVKTHEGFRFRAEKFFRNVGHIGHRVMREVRKNQGKAIQGEGVTPKKGFKRAYAQLFKKDISAGEANKLVEHLLKGDDKLLKGNTPSLGKQLVKILEQCKPEGLTQDDTNMFNKIQEMEKKQNRYVGMEGSGLSLDKKAYLTLLNNAQALLEKKGNYENYKNDFVFLSGELQDESFDDASSVVSQKQPTSVSSSSI